LISHHLRELQTEASKWEQYCPVLLPIQEELAMTIYWAMAENIALESCHVRFHRAYVFSKAKPDSEEAASRMEWVTASFSIASHGRSRYPQEAEVVRKAVEPES
jgi:hypothetical protein